MTLGRQPLGQRADRVFTLPQSGLVQQNLSVTKRDEVGRLCEWQGRRRDFVWLFLLGDQPSGQPVALALGDQPADHEGCVRDKNWPASRPAPP